jgi:hypothetical protein
MIGELVAQVIDGGTPDERIEILRADEYILIGDEMLHPNPDIRIGLAPGTLVRFAGQVTYRLTGERDIGGAWHAIRVET